MPTKHTTHFKGCGCPHVVTDEEGLAWYMAKADRYGVFRVTAHAGECPHCGCTLHGIVSQQDRKTGECTVPGWDGNEGTLYECFRCGAVRTLYDSHPGSWREPA